MKEEEEEGETSSLFRFDRVNVFEELHDAQRVRELVVVPRDQLEEVVVEEDRRFHVQHRWARVAGQIRRDELFVSDAQHTFQPAFGSCLAERGHHCFFRRRFLGANSQIDLVVVHEQTMMTQMR